MNNSIALKRRTFLNQAGLGLGMTAFHSLLSRDVSAAPVPQGLSPMLAKAKRVIFLGMSGGPSHLETFDYKPKLDQMDGKPMPESFTKGQPIAQLQGQALRVLGHQTKFRKHGHCGQMVSDFLPHTAKMVDDIAVIRSMVTEQINHDPAHTFMNTGTVISGRPSMGSWVNYGLGSESQDLPGFVVLTSVGGRNPQPIASRQWSSGFLPSRFIGSNSSGRRPRPLRSNPSEVSSKANPLSSGRSPLGPQENAPWANPEVDTRISAYEMAFRMQSTFRIDGRFGRTSSALELRGVKSGDGSYASNCLLPPARGAWGALRSLVSPRMGHHGGLANHMKICCGLTDRPTLALRLTSSNAACSKTLGHLGGEFGRTPMFQGKGELAGIIISKAFPCGWRVESRVASATGDGRARVSCGERRRSFYADLHATLVHQLGINHENFSFQYQCLDMRF